MFHNYNDKYICKERLALNHLLFKVITEQCITRMFICPRDKILLEITLDKFYHKSLVKIYLAIQTPQHSRESSVYL